MEALVSEKIPLRRRGYLRALVKKVSKENLALKNKIPGERTPGRNAKGIFDTR